MQSGGLKRAALCLDSIFAAEPLDIQEEQFVRIGNPKAQEKNTEGARNTGRNRRGSARNAARQAGTCTHYLSGRNPVLDGFGSCHFRCGRAAERNEENGGSRTTIKSAGKKKIQRETTQSGKAEARFSPDWKANDLGGAP